MPTFGDYETTGEPLAMSDGVGHLSQIWLARKTTGTDNHQYTVKIYVPRPRRRAATEEGELEEDRAQEFLETVMQIKKAQSDGGKDGSRLTPIYDFGRTPEGNAAWYVTDLYGEADPFLSGSLQSYIIRGGRVDAAALDHIVYSVATACLALQRSRGYSHGNLKSSNVFRVVKSKPLRNTPLQVGNLLAAVPAGLNSAAPEDLKSVSELLRQTMEAQDLRTIGELVVQLVEGRVILSDRDYDYPIQDSAGWQRLGSDGERWREFCNRVLDPGMSLDRVNLVTLEKEFRPGVFTQPMALAATAGVCVLVVGIILFAHSRKKGSSQTPGPPGAPQIVQQPQEQTIPPGGAATLTVGASGGPALKYQWRFNGTALSGATTSSLSASKAGTYDVQVSGPGGSTTSKPAVLALRQAGTPAQFAAEMQAAQQAFDSASGDYVTNLTTAFAHVNSALALAPNDASAAQLKDKIANGMNAAMANAMQNGLQFAAQGNLRDAMKERAVVSSFKPDDPRLPQLTSSIFKAADAAATNATGGNGNMVNLDAAERDWKYMQALAPSDHETTHVKSFINEFDKLIAQAVAKAQAAINADIKTPADASNLLHALDATGVFDWRPSRTNTTQALVEKLEQKRRDAIATAFEGSTTALEKRNFQDANNRLEIMKVLNKADPLVGKLDELIRRATAAPPRSAPPPSDPAPSPAPAPNNAVAPADQQPSEKRGPTNVLGIDFVWLKDIGSAGAYVAVNELSKDLWHALDGGNAGRGGDPNVPALFPNANEARSFAARQSDNFSNQGFHARLPSLNEYLTMVGIKSAQTSGLSAADRSKITHAELPTTPKALPTRVSDGLVNANGLRNALGNVREWTSDSANPFGYAYFWDREFFGQSPYDNLTATPKYGEEVGGVRLVLEPK